MIIKIKPCLILFLEGEVRPRGEVRDSYSRKRYNGPRKWDTVFDRI